MCEKELTARQLLAAQRLAEDEWSDEKIAAEAGVGRSGMAKWKLRPDFQAAIRDHRDALNAAVQDIAIARKERRVSRKNRHWLLLQRQVDETPDNPDPAKLAEMRALELDAAKELGQLTDRKDIAIVDRNLFERFVKVTAKHLKDDAFEAWLKDLKADMQEGSD